MKKTQTKVQDQVAVKQRVAVSVMMMAAFVLVLSFAGIAVKELNSKELLRPNLRSISTRPIPMVTQGINDAVLNLAHWQGNVYEQNAWPQGEFTINGQELGRLDMVYNDYYSNGTTTGQVKGPLALTLSHSAEETVNLPERIVHISNYDGSAYNLCIPSTDVPGNGDGSINGEFTYYYDVNGTPYYDNLLTQKALPQDCNRLLTNGLDIEQIDDASANLNQYYQGGESQVYILRDFKHPNINFGVLSLTSNRFYKDYDQNNDIYSPLALLIPSTSDRAYDFKSRIINISNILGESYNLCLPDSHVPSFEINGAEPIYFYDNSGTPYYDSLLIEKAMTGSCSDVLARSLDVDSVNDAKVNVRVTEAYDWQSTYGDWGINALPNIKFLSDFSEYTDDYGSLDLGANDYSYHNFEPNNDIISPLAVQVESNDDQSTRTIPSRLVYIIDPDEQGHTLCLPQTTVLPETPLPINKSIYFYDNSGTPYYDSLLTRRALPQNCNEIIARVLDISDISNAQLDRVMDLGDINTQFASFPLDYTDPGESMGGLNLVDNYFYHSTYMPPNSYNEVASPFTVFIDNFDNQENINLPYRNIIVTDSDGQNHNLCFPPSVVPGGDGLYNNNVQYFYDINGKPYADSLLFHRVTCPPLKPIDELPQEAIGQ